MTTFDAGKYIDEMTYATGTHGVVAYRHADGRKQLSFCVLVGNTKAQRRRYDAAHKRRLSDPEADRKLLDECLRRGLVVDIPADWPAGAADPQG